MRLKSLLSAQPTLDDCDKTATERQRSLNPGFSNPLLGDGHSLKVSEPAFHISISVEPHRTHKAL